MYKIAQEKNKKSFIQINLAILLYLCIYKRTELKVFLYCISLRKFFQNLVFKYFDCCQRIKKQSLLGTIAKSVTVTQYYN